VTTQALWRVAVDGRVRLARGPVDRGPQELLESAGDVDDLLGGGPQTLTSAIEGQAVGAVPPGARTLVPIAGQEVWASGVTYERSRQARNEEAGLLRPGLRGVTPGVVCEGGRRPQPGPR